MMKNRHFTIPVFVPEEACPNRCVFCNQYRISSATGMPAAGDVIQKVEKLLATMPVDSDTEIGFFGGNFTGIGLRQQEEYLLAVQPYLASGRVKSLRISTRPDYIDQERLSLLKAYGVKAIELGAQSLDDEVLHLTGRGHTAQQVHDASRLITEAGFELGLQMMIGLPGDTPEKSMFTALEIVRLGAATTRIYPTLVIKDTDLEQWFLKGKYQPLTLEEAVVRTASLVPVFSGAGVRILRMGLHPSEGLQNRTSLVAGPFHEAFGAMVYSEIWKQRFAGLPAEAAGCTELEIQVPVGQRSAAIGHGAANKKNLLSRFRKVAFTETETLKPFEFNAVYS